MRANGSIERYKVHLVALEIDKSMPWLKEPSDIVAKMTIFHTVMAITTSKGWLLHQLNAKYLFLHGDLKEEIFKTPLGMF